MSRTADLIERALNAAHAARTPVIVSTDVLQQAVDELRTDRPKGKIAASSYDRGVAQGKADEKRANAAGEKALTTKLAKVIEVVGYLEHTDAGGHEEGHVDTEELARLLRGALGLGDVKIACPCGAA